MSDMVFVDVSGIDWKLLREQKAVLYEIAESGNQRQRDAAEGLLSLLDDLQDKAAEILGDGAVFGVRAL